MGFSRYLKEWFVANLLNHLGEVDWTCFWGLIAWRISKNHNHYVFQGISCSVEEVIEVLYCWLNNLPLSEK